VRKVGKANKRPFFSLTYDAIAVCASCLKFFTVAALPTPLPATDPAVPGLPLKFEPWCEAAASFGQNETN
jgi:hypothetical protein